MFNKYENPQGHREIMKNCHSLPKNGTSKTDDGKIR